MIVQTLEKLEQKPPVDCEHGGTIVTGDFNSLQWNSHGPESTFTVFQSSGFKDACTESGARNVPFLSFHDWDAQKAAASRCPAKLRQRGISHAHIDWILWRGHALRLADFEVDTRTESCPPSDHFAIVATFRIEPAKHGVPPATQGFQHGHCSGQY